MTLEIVFIGLCAIVMSEELDCKRSTIPIAHSTDPLNVILLYGSQPYRHEPILWIPVDNLAEVPDKCWTEAGRQASIPSQSTPPGHTTECDTNTPAKWARFELKDFELRIVQELTASAKVRKGYRKLKSDHCWEGTNPDPVGCKLDSAGAPLADCHKDASWVPDYAKVVGTGVIKKAFLEAPQESPLVASFIKNLRGTLEAHHAASSNVWHWEWNHPACATTEAGKLDDYTQQFGHHAVVRDIVTSMTSIWLVPLKPRTPEKEIKLTGTPKLEIWNLPIYYDMEPGTPPPWATLKGVKRGNRCYIPHFDAFSHILENPPACRRIPYFLTTACDGSAGAGDSFCPPVLFSR